MTEERFWAIIQHTFDQSLGSADLQAQLLAEQLQPLPPTEIASFDRLFETQRRRAYTWDLWGAAYVINGGCSDDGFVYFRDWLVSRGRGWFERALHDPDSLADYPEDLAQNPPEFEDFAYVAIQVYERKAGDMPDHGDLAEEPGEPRGESWDETAESVLQTRWPRLCAKYW